LLCGVAAVLDDLETVSGFRDTRRFRSQGRCRYKDVGILQGNISQMGPLNSETKQILWPPHDIVNSHQRHEFHPILRIKVSKPLGKALNGSFTPNLTPKVAHLAQGSLDMIAIPWLIQASIQD